MIDFNHLTEIKESYFVHLSFTVRLFVGFLFLACISLIHGLFPFILTGTVSNKIKNLHKVLSER